MLILCNLYITLVQSLHEQVPPYAAALSRSPFTGDAFSLVNTQIENSIPLRSPMTFMPFTLDLADRKPFRLMIMEIAMKKMALDKALERTAGRMNALALPNCIGGLQPVKVQACDPATGFTTMDYTNMAVDAGITCKVDMDRTVLGTLKCTLVPYESVPAFVAFGLIAVAALMFVIFALLVITRRNMVTVGRTDLVSSEFILVGLLLITIAGFLTLGTPSTFTCTGRVWFLLTGFSLTFGLMLARLLSRYYRTVATVPISIVVIVNLALLLAWTFVAPGPSKSATTTTVLRDFEQDAGIQMELAACAPGSLPVVYTMFAFNLLVLFGGFAIAWVKVSQEVVTKLSNEYRAYAFVFIMTAVALSMSIALTAFLDEGIRGQVMIFCYTALSVAILSLLILGRSMLVHTTTSGPYGSKPLKIVSGSASDFNTARQRKTVSSFGTRPQKLDLERAEEAADDAELPTAPSATAGAMTDSTESLNRTNAKETDKLNASKNSAFFVRPLTMATEAQFNARDSGMTLFTMKNNRTSMDSVELEEEQMEEAVASLPAPPPPIIVRNTMAPTTQQNAQSDDEDAGDNDDVLVIDEDEELPSKDIPPVQLFQHRQSAYQSVYGGLGMADDMRKRGRDNRPSTMFDNDLPPVPTDTGDSDDDDLDANIEAGMRMRFKDRASVINQIGRTQPQAGNGAIKNKQLNNYLERS
jgi:hypothetical protein